MSKDKKSVIEVQGTAIAVLNQNSQDFICLTDMAKKFGDDILIYSWMRNRNTLEFIGVWEQIHNPDFKGLEFETFRNQAGLNSFSLTHHLSFSVANLSRAAAFYDAAPDSVGYVRVWADETTVG